MTNYINELAKSFGMRPFKDEPYNHFEARVLSVKEAREQRENNSWRKTYKEKL